jgi:hypothetical protein
MSTANHNNTGRLDINTIMSVAPADIEAADTSVLNQAAQILQSYIEKAKNRAEAKELEEQWCYIARELELRGLRPR